MDAHIAAMADRALLSYPNTIKKICLARDSDVVCQSLRAPLVEGIMDLCMFNDDVFLFWSIYRFEKVNIYQLPLIGVLRVSHPAEIARDPGGRCLLQFLT